MTATRSATLSGRDRLLDAAEELFAMKGYDGASMRAITRLAGVELGLANYHFGTKDELFRQVLARRAPVMAADLDAALAKAANGRTLAAIFSAFARTHLMRLHDEEPGWRSYMRLAADVSLKEARDDLTGEASAIYQPVLERYLEAVARFRIATSRDELERAFYIFHMAVLSLLINAGPNGKAHAPPSAKQVDALVATMVRIFAEGL